MKRVFNSTKQNIAHGVNRRPPTGIKRKIKRERAFEIREAWDNSDYAAAIKSFTAKESQLTLVSRLSAELSDLERIVIRQLREPHYYDSDEDNIREVVSDNLLEWENRLSSMAEIFKAASKRAWELLDQADSENHFS